MIQKSLDIAFLHPPSILNKEEIPLSGVFNSESGSTDLFTVFPAGLLNMAHFLISNDYRTRIYNVSEMILKEKFSGNFNLDKTLSEIKARAYGIDLHWAVHTPGALELARIVKEKYPQSLVFLGGLSANFFHREILRDHPYIDFVMRGECDEVIIELAKHIGKEKFNPSTVPNIAFRKGNQVRCNSYQKNKLKEINYHDFSIIEPTPHPLIPMTIPVIRGCNQKCLFCGGSAYSYKRFHFREKLKAIRAELIIDQIRKFQQKGGNSVFLYGDFRLAGQKYVGSFLKHFRGRLKEMRIRNELFYPAKPDYLKRWKDKVPNISFTFSPESSDFKVRRNLGKEYPDEEILRQVELCRDLEIPLAVCFFYALPYQDWKSIEGTLSLMDEVLRIGGEKIFTMIEPQLFLDPGSEIFMKPKQWGFKIFFKTLKDLKENLTRPHWMYSLGYETMWLSREEIIESILKATELKLELLSKYNIISAPNFLKSYENVMLNRRFVSQMLKESAYNREQVKSEVNRIFPDYLCFDNDLIKDYSRTLMDIAKNEVPIPYDPKLSSPLLDGFPLIHKFLFQHSQIQPASFISEYIKWRENLDSGWQDLYLSSPQQLIHLEKAPILMKEFLKKTLGKHTNLDNEFVSELIDFEWFSYQFRRLHYKSKKVDSEPIITREWGFNFANLGGKDWKEVLKPQTTKLSYNLKTGKISGS
jgi:B12-binding domain/radical SAM domain protein